MFLDEELIFTDAPLENLYTGDMLTLAGTELTKNIMKLADAEGYVLRDNCASRFIPRPPEGESTVTMTVREYYVWAVGTKNACEDMDTLIEDAMTEYGNPSMTDWGAFYDLQDEVSGDA